jgi:hypothetical protein
MKISSMTIDTHTNRRPAETQPLKVLRGKGPGRFVPGADMGIAGIIAVLVVAVYAQTLGHAFLNWDDNQYVSENPHVMGGLGIGAVLWAFTTMHAANWHPLTWLSHMADVSLFGLNPAGHHLTNVCFHLANSLLLFVLFRKLTATRWRSGAVAVLFAVHPLHVESVAWIAERKDLLSAFFWMLTLLAYVRYTRCPDGRGRFTVAVLYACGLMAKPMVVTLPVVLLLLDYWPLRRLQTIMTGGVGVSAAVQRLIWEKVPLFLLTALSCILTLMAQQGGGRWLPWRFFHWDPIGQCRRLLSVLSRSDPVATVIVAMVSSPGNAVRVASQRIGVVSRHRMLPQRFIHAVPSVVHRGVACGGC